MIYIIFVIAFLLCIFKYDYCQETNGRKVVYQIILLLLLLLLGLRYRIGTDTLTYSAVFETFPTLDNLTYSYVMSSRYAPLWIVFFSSLKSLTVDFIAVQFVISAFILFSLHKTLQYFKLERYSFTVLFFYFIGPCYAMNCEQMREAVAISLFLMSLPSLNEKRYKHYYIYTLFAFGFHHSAFIMFVFPFMALLKVNIKSIVILLTLIPITSLVREYISYLDTFLSYLSFDVYIYRIMEADEKTWTIGAIIAKIIVPLGCSYYLKKKNALPPILESLTIIMVGISILSQGIFILYRYVTFLSIPKMIIYTLFLYNILNTSNNIRKPIYMCSLLLFLYIEGCFWFKPLSWADRYWYELIEPYSSVIDKKTHPIREGLYWQLDK